MTLAPIDDIPLWVVFVLTALLLFLSAEVAFQMGRRRRGQYQDAEKATSGTILGAVLGLLAFLLAFTFGMAGSINSDRKKLVGEEANAVGTAYLRAELLPEKQSAEIQTLLREYVDIRVEVQDIKRVADAKPIIDRSEELHDQLWAHAVDLAEGNSEPIFTGLFVESLNEVIDLHSKRVTAGIRSRIPGSIMVTLYFVAILAMGMMGYQAGRSGVRVLVTRFILILAFSSVVMLIVELDRPFKTIIKVSQQAMLDLQEEMRKAGQ